MLHSIIFSEKMTNKSPLSLSASIHQLPLHFCLLQHFHIRHPLSTHKILSIFLQNHIPAALSLFAMTLLIVQDSHPYVAL
uniref:Uncharacterized protein n=1 Tax=Octopus bimaculoides TaxID=37653 RepID=A0A0L8I255_OCTBM